MTHGPCLLPNTWSFASMVISTLGGPMQSPVDTLSTKITTSISHTTRWWLPSGWSAVTLFFILWVWHKPYLKWKSIEWMDGCNIIIFTTYSFIYNCSYMLQCHPCDHSQKCEFYILNPWTSLITVLCHVVSAATLLWGCWRFVFLIQRSSSRTWGLQKPTCCRTWRTSLKSNIISLIVLISLHPCIRVKHTGSHQRIMYFSNKDMSCTVRRNTTELQIT